MRVKLSAASDSGGTSRAMSWSARQYVQFEDERTRPVRDLLAALPAIDARSVIDIGCGPGNSTELLAARFAGAAVSGFDSSADMIAAARRRLPGLRFDLADVERWAYENDATDAGSAPGVAATAAAAPFDVILANAVLHWVPDHARLFPALAAKLAPGGALAVQMPDNLDEPAHRLMREIAADGPWAAKLTAAAAARPSMPTAERYDEMLTEAGCRVDIWRTTYYHALSGGAEAVVEWFKGSGLRPFITPLGDEEREEFLMRYRSAVARAYPARSDGGVLLPFPRLFIIAVH
jgi:trans-aconitate 2-methyltransferase